METWAELDGPHTAWVSAATKESVCPQLFIGSSKSEVRATLLGMVQDGCGVTESEGEKQVGVTPRRDVRAGKCPGPQEGGTQLNSQSLSPALWECLAG